MTNQKLQPKTWRKVKLGEVATIISGYAFQSSDFSNSGIPVIKIKNIASGFLNLNDIECYSGSLSRLEKYIINKGDILISMTGSHPSQWSSVVGKIARNNSDKKLLLNQRVGKIKPNIERINNDYLYYCLWNDEITLRLANRASGSANQANISPETIKSLELIIPSLPEQQKITSFFLNLDRKIELNNKISQNLEQIAQAIFKEWFSTKDGKLPKDWVVKRIGDIASIVLGGTPSRLNKEFWGGEIPWINSGKANEFRIISASEYITKKGLRKSNTRMMPKRTTVIAITGATLGQVSLLEIEACANQSVVGIFGSELLSSEFIYLFIKNKINEITQEAAGGAQQHINKGIIENYPILVPDRYITLKFNKIIKPIFDQTSNNIFENQKLASLRDLLLPKLMSGEIRV